MSIVVSIVCPLCVHHAGGTPIVSTTPHPGNTWCLATCRIVLELSSMSSCFTFPVYILMTNNILLTVGGRNSAPLYGEYLTMSFSFPCVCPPLSPPALILICPCPQAPGIDLRLPMSLEPLIAILNLGVAKGGLSKYRKSWLLWGGAKFPPSTVTGILCFINM